MSGRPPEQNCFRRHLHEAFQLLPSLQQVGQARALLQADLVEQTHPDYLPQQAQHQVGSPCMASLSLSYVIISDIIIVIVIVIVSPLIRSLASMLTRLQPILWAEARASVRFSCLGSSQSELAGAGLANKELPFIDTIWLHVDDSLVHRVWAGVVHDLAQ